VGRFLRFIVKIDIRKPLMRGITVIADSNNVERWCPLAYEHLPDFCYVCGLLGHTDKLCDVAWEKGKPLPYSRSLRCSLPNKKGVLELGEEENFARCCHGVWGGVAVIAMRSPGGGVTQGEKRRRGSLVLQERRRI
jgi:hypothetical protein